MNKVTITANGKERLFRFDLKALELMTDDTKFTGQFAFIAKMLWAGLSSACYAKDIDNDFTKEDVLDMVDELSLTEEGKEKLALLNKCLTESQAFKSLIQKEENEDEEKKTLTGIGYTPLHLEKSA